MNAALAQITADAIVGTQSALREKTAQRLTLNFRIRAARTSITLLGLSRVVIRGRNYPRNLTAVDGPAVTAGLLRAQAELAPLLAQLAQANREIADLQARLASYQPPLVAPAPPQAVIAAPLAPAPVYLAPAPVYLAPAPAHVGGKRGRDQ